MERPSHVVNVEDLEWSGQSHGSSFEHRRKALASAAAGERLGCSLYELPPGKRAFPHHCHGANEEAIYVLSGEGTVRLGDDRFPVRSGDYVAFRVGPEGAHQVRAAADASLVYLCFSTMIDPDVVYYPDTDKIGALAGAPPGGDAAKRYVSAWLPAAAAVDYWDGED